MRREGTPTRRRVVAGHTALALLLLVLLVIGTDALRHDTPPAAGPGPAPAGAIDALREGVGCPLPPLREGRAPATSRPRRDTAHPVSSAELADCPTSWDGRVVRVVGEVVGTILSRGDHAWVQLNDDAYGLGLGPLPTHRAFRGANAGIGARLDVRAADQITSVGGSGVRGDVVEVVATFRRVDARSTEVAVLEVHSLQVLRPGGQVEEPRASGRAAAASISAAAAVLVIGVDHRRRRR